MYVYGQHFRQNSGQAGMVANSACGQLNGEDEIVYFSLSPLRLIAWSAGKVRPSRPASASSFSTQAPDSA